MHQSVVTVVKIGDCGNVEINIQPRNRNAGDAIKDLASESTVNLYPFPVSMAYIHDP